MLIRRQYYYLVPAFFYLTLFCSCTSNTEVHKKPVIKYEVWSYLDQNGINYNFFSYQSKSTLGIIPVKRDAGIYTVNELANAIVGSLINERYFDKLKRDDVKLVIVNNQPTYDGYELSSLDIVSLKSALSKHASNIEFN